MKIKINSEEELVKVAQEAVHILNNLRHWTKLWNAHHGKDLRDRKQYWEEKADLFLEQLQVEEHRGQNQIKIEVNGSEEI